MNICQNDLFPRDFGILDEHICYRFKLLIFDLIINRFLSYDHHRIKPYCVTKFARKNSFIVTSTEQIKYHSFIAMTWGKRY